MLVNRRTLRIQWGDCDPAGIVYFPRYFEMFDVSSSLMMEVAGYPKHKALQQFGVVGWPLIDVGAKFVKPSTYGEDVDIETRVTEWGRSSFRIEHRLLSAEELRVEGWEKRVWVGRHPDDPARLKSVPIPDAVLQKFQE